MIMQHPMFPWILFATTIIGFCFYIMKKYIDSKYTEALNRQDTEYRWIREDLNSLENKFESMKDKAKD
jgi:hypothetical protein